MAIVSTATFGSSPSGTYELHAEQIGGSGNQRTVRATLRLKVNGSGSSNYGYPLHWRARIKNSWSSYMHVKGNEYWRGGEAYREFSWTTTVDVGTTAATNITIGFQLARSDGGSSSWNVSKEGSFQVNRTNTRPYFPSNQQWVNIREGGSASGTLLSGIIPENISTLYIDWGQASDNEGGTLMYSLNHKINGGNWGQIDFGSDRAHSYIIGAGNEGQTLEYCVDVRDDAGEWSDKIYSTKITKNSFTGSTLNDITSIVYNTSSITLTWTNPNNTTTHVDKDKFNFNITCDGLNLYNSSTSNAARSMTFKIVSSPLTDGSPYILKNDIKNLFADSFYKGTLIFTLTSSNAYGSSRTSAKLCTVNLQSDPNPVTGLIISTDTSKSTCYQKPVAAVDSYYFIPDGSKLIRIEWKAGSGKIGENITYDIQVAYGNENWTLLESGLTTTYYNHKIPKQTVSRSVKYRVITRTAYGTNSIADTSAVTLHYYNLPTLTVGAIVRTSTTATVSVTIKSATSLSGITTVGTWTCNNKGTSTAISNGNLSSSQESQKLSINNLTESGQYDLKITYQDNTVFSSNIVSPTINIGQTKSVMFVNRYGVGINGEVATSEHSLKINGVIAATNFSGREIIRSGKDLNNYTKPGFYTTDSDGDSNGIINRPPSGVGFLLVVGTTYNNNRIVQEATMRDNGVRYTRNRTESGDWSAWIKHYSENAKPSKADVGLGSVNNWGASSTISANSTSQYATTNMVAQVRAEKLNLSGGTMTGSLTMPDFNLKDKGSSINLNTLLNEACCRTTDQAVNRPSNYCLVRTFGIGDGFTFQLASYYGSGNAFYLRSQHDTTKAWQPWERIYTTGYTGNLVTNKDNISRLADGGSYMEVARHNGLPAKGITWWDSDKKFKNNIIELNDNIGLNIINQIKHYSFDYDEEHGSKHLECGYVAQQLEEIDEKLILKIKQDKDCSLYTEEDPYTRHPDQTVIIPYLSKAIQELYSENLKLKDRILEIEKRLEEK